MDWAGVLDDGFTAAVGLQAAYFALAAIGLNIHFGYTGLLDFGVAGFMTVGAYGLGVSVAYYGWPWPVGVLVGILASVVFALLLGFPTLRLRADYLAIVTIAAAEIVRIAMRATALRDITGGSNGINGFSGGFYDLNPFSDGVSVNLGLFNLDFRADQLWILTVGWALVLLAVLFTWLAMRSPWGRVVKSVREDEDAARSLGKNSYSVKMQSLVIGGILAALGGMVFVLGQGSVQPSPQDLGTPKTFFIWVAMILGGTGTIWGPVIGSMIFSGLLALTDSALRNAEQEELLPEALITGVQVGQVRFILMGLGLMLLMIFRPQGIFGNKEELMLDER